MRPNPHDPRGHSVLADLAVLEEEVDASLGSAHSAVALGEPPLAAAASLELAEQRVEAIEGVPPCAHGRRNRACL